MCTCIGIRVVRKSIGMRCESNAERAAHADAACEVAQGKPSCRCIEIKIIKIKKKPIPATYTEDVGSEDRTSAHKRENTALFDKARLVILRH